MMRALRMTRSHLSASGSARADGTGAVAGAIVGCRAWREAQPMETSVSKKAMCAREVIPVLYTIHGRPAFSVSGSDQLRHRRHQQRAVVGGGAAFGEGVDGGHRLAGQVLGGEVAGEQDLVEPLRTEQLPAARAGLGDPVGVEDQRVAGPELLRAVDI